MENIDNIEDNQMEIEEYEMGEEKMGKWLGTDMFSKFVLLNIVYFYSRDKFLICIFDWLIDISTLMDVL